MTSDLKGILGKVRRDTFERLLAFTDLARFQDRQAGRLSGGVKQKLATFEDCRVNVVALLVIGVVTSGVALAVFRRRLS